MKLMGKTKMKRFVSAIIGVILVTQLVFSSTLFAVSDTATAEESVSDKLKVLSTLGVVDTISETNITRGEFAVFVAKMMGLDASGAVSERCFKDIDRNNRYAAAVHALYKKGIVNGVEEGYFAPDDAITNKTAAVILLRAAGYANIVKNFEDYSVYISTNGLYNGISGTMLSGKNAVTMLYNALDIDMCVVDTLSTSDTTYTIDKDESFLEYYFDIYRVKDVIKAADGISLDNDVSVRDNETVIGDKTYLAENANITAELYDNIGAVAEAYIKETDEDYDTVVCVLKKSSASEELIINARDMGKELGSDMVLEYYVNDRAKTIALPKNITVLKNGVVVTQDIAKAFDIDSGYIRLVKNDGKYKVAVIYAFEYAFVSSVNEKEKMIYSKSGSPINVDEAEYGRMVIYKSDNSIGTISDIKAGMLIEVLRSSEMLQISISANAVLGKIEAISGDKLRINSNDYEMEKRYAEKLKSMIELGKSGTFYLNRFNEICWYISGNDSGYSYGYLVKATVDDSWKDTLKVKIFTADGSMEILEAKDKIRVDGYSLSISQAIAELKVSGGGYISQLVAYKQNKDGKLADIDTVKANKSEGGLRQTGAPSTRYYYKYTSGTILVPDVALKTGGVIFKTPKQANAENASNDDFKIVSSIKEGEEMSCSAYTMDSEGIYSDAVVYEKTGSVNNIDWKTYPSMVDSVYNSVDDKGEAVKMLRVVGRPKESLGVGVYDYVISEDFEVPDEGIVGDWKNSVNNGKYASYEDVSEGDIIICNFDDDDEITRLILYFDYDSLEASVSQIGKYKTYPKSDGRFVAGYALEREDAFLSMSSKGIGEERDELFMINSSITIFDDERREDKIYIGSKEDILTYEETSSTSSVVIPWYMGAWTAQIFAYRNGLPND